MNTTMTQLCFHWFTGHRSIDAASLTCAIPCRVSLTVVEDLTSNARSFAQKMPLYFGSTNHCCLAILSVSSSNPDLPATCLYLRWPACKLSKAMSSETARTQTATTELFCMTAMNKVWIQLWFLLNLLHIFPINLPQIHSLWHVAPAVKNISEDIISIT